MPVFKSCPQSNYALQRTPGSGLGVSCSVLGRVPLNAALGYWYAPLLSVHLGRAGRVQVGAPLMRATMVPVHSCHDRGPSGGTFSSGSKGAIVRIVAGASWAAWRSNRRRVSYTLAESLTGVVACI